MLKKKDAHWNKKHYIIPSGQNRQLKQYERVRFLLIRHSKYSAMYLSMSRKLSEYIPGVPERISSLNWYCGTTRRDISKILFDWFSCSKSYEHKRGKV